MISISHPTNRPNFSKVDTDGWTVWFSYETPIAFHTPETGLIVRENEWGPTTGKHLNAIDGGRPWAFPRVTGKYFTEAMRTVGIPA